MKNILFMITFSVIAFTNLILLSGCSYDTDNDIASKNLEKLLTAIENEDYEGITALFAPNIKNNIEDFSESMNTLILYYEGEQSSVDNWGLGATYDVNNGIEIKYLNMSYDITTTENKYRMGIIWYIQDTGDENNVGIWSLYVLKFEDDIMQDYAYRSEGENGIHVGKVRKLD